MRPAVADSPASPSLNESPPEKEGKLRAMPTRAPQSQSLNESPSKKEGKSMSLMTPAASASSASMKALPKRKGNGGDPHRSHLSSRASMKVYTSRYRTNGPAVIRGILICPIESPHKVLGIIFSDFGANVSARP